MNYLNKRLPQKHYIFIFLKYFFNQTIYFIYSKIIAYPYPKKLKLKKRKQII